MRILVSIAVLGSAATMGAQEVAGHIEGRVVGDDGEAVESVLITASSPHMIGTRTTITGRDGRYYLRALPVGAYRVEVRRLGYRPVVVDSVRVWLGSITALSPVQMAVAAVELNAVTIAADDGALDPSSTATSVVLRRDRLGQLPIGRDFRQIAILLPQATPSFLGDGINVAGATGLENRYFVDGIDITDPILGARSIDLPYNFIQQIQLRTGGVNAGDPSALGGTVNVVTPSGGNTGQGSAFAYFSNDGLQAPGRPLAGAVPAGFQSTDVGATIGGPIARDRVWFFAAYNPRFERRTQDYAFGDLVDETRVHQFAGKLTARLGGTGGNSTATLTLIGDPRTSTPVGGNLFVQAVAAGAVPLLREAFQREDRGGGFAVAGRTQSQIGRSMFIEGTITHMSMKERGRARTGREPAFLDFTSGTVGGGHGYEYDRDAERQSVAADASLLKGSHRLEVGAKLERLRSGNWLWLETVSNVGSGFTRLRTVADVPGEIENRNPALHVQDVWQAAERLSVTIGARVSRQEIAGRAQGSTRFRLRDGVQPRLAVVYQPGELGKQRLFASYARVVHQVALASAIGNQRGFTKLHAFPQDPRVDSSGGTLVFELIRDGRGEPADAGLRAPMADHWQAGYARQLSAGLIVSATAERRELRQHLEAAGNDGNPIWGNPGRGALSAFPRPTRTYDALHVGLQWLADTLSWWHLAYTLSRIRGNFPGLYTTDYRLASPHYGPAFDMSAAWVNSTGLLPNDRTHTMRAFGWRSLSRDLGLGASLFAGSGTPLSEYWVLGASNAFHRERGSTGRTPWIWDAALRGTYELHRALGRETRLLVDVEHVGNPRKAVDFEQTRYFCPARDVTCENPAYGRVTRYQPPMTARLGVDIRF